MKPNFALSLSFDGIALLHRAAGGWRVVGDVALDADDMGAELAVLRRTASALEPGGVRTKLLVPNAQIKYLTIDTPGMDDAARKSAAKGALDGATPYAVDDLAYDVSVNGDRTHIAAVARETLAEAEAFAVEHRFHPVSFAAVPGDQPYLGEPFFGPTTAAAALLDTGETVEPDGIAVVVIGDVQPQEDAPAPAVEPDTTEEQEAAFEDAADAAPPAEQAPPVPPVVEAPQTEDAPARAADDVPATVTKDEDVGKVENDAPVAEVPAAPIASKPEDEPTKPAAAEPVAVQTATDPAPRGLNTSDKPGAAVTVPPLGAASRAPQGKPTAPSIAAPAQASAAPALGFASRRSTDTAKTPTGRREPSLGAPKAPAPSPAAQTGEPMVSVASPTVPDVGGAILPDSASLAPRAADADATAPSKAGFLSRRKAKPASAPASKVSGGVIVAEPGSEAERMTVFGARGTDVGGKPRFLGLVLTAALLIFLAGVAAWASVFLDDGMSLSRLFGDREPRVTASAPQTPKPAEDGIETASLDPELSPEDGAVLDALRAPVLPPVAPPSAAEAEAKYAATGIWPRAPDVPPEPAALIDIEDLYVTSIDPVSTSSDAVALPAPQGYLTDVAFGSVASPVAAGTAFAYDARGLIVPTAQGALSPDGFTVYLGRPAVFPAAFPERAETETETPQPDTALAGLRPRLRPGDLAETTERAQLDGLTRSELADLRPRLRPQSVQEIAAAAQAPATDAPAVNTDAAVTAALAAVVPAPAVDNATRFAVRASLRPDIRPRNFARIVRRAERSAPAAQTQVASSAAVAPRVVTPRNPTKTSVARAATVSNAINLRKVNLIGVYGKPSNRRALVRLGNGRYQKVVVGDRIDGGRVSAIGDGELRYSKRGRDVILKMPSG